AMAMAQPVAGTSCRSATVGADCRAISARRPLRPDVRSLARGLDGRDDVSRSHDQRFARIPFNEPTLVRRRFGQIGADDVDTWLPDIASLIAPRSERLDRL